MVAWLQGWAIPMMLHISKCVAKAPTWPAHSARRRRRFRLVPNGRNAGDLEHFVNPFGYTGNEALAPATGVGGQIMDMDDELGQLVDGDPIRDIKRRQNRDNVLMIMKEENITRHRGGRHDRHSGIRVNEGVGNLDSPGSV